MPEAIAEPNSAHEIERFVGVREILRNGMEVVDKAMSFDRLRTTFVQSLLLALTVSITILGVVLLNSPSTTITVLITVLSAVCVVLVTLVIGYRSPNELVHLMAMRQQLRNHMVEIDMYVHAGKSMDAERMDEIIRSALTELDELKSAAGNEGRPGVAG